MYVLGVDLHLLVQPFGTGDFLLIVQVVQSAIFGGDVQTVVRSIDNLADSLSAQMIETGSVWIYLELVGTEYIIVDSSEIGSYPHIMSLVLIKAVNGRIVQRTSIPFRLFVMCNQLVEFVEDKDAILRAYPYIPRMVGCRTPEVFHFKVFREITQGIALYMIDEKIVVSIK